MYSWSPLGKQITYFRYFGIYQVETCYRIYRRFMGKNTKFVMNCINRIWIQNA